MHNSRQAWIAQKDLDAHWSHLDPLYAVAVPSRIPPIVHAILNSSPVLKNKPNQPIDHSIWKIDIPLPNKIETMIPTRCEDRALKPRCRDCSGRAHPQNEQYEAQRHLCAAFAGDRVVAKSSAVHLLLIPIQGFPIFVVMDWEGS